MLKRTDAAAMLANSLLIILGVLVTVWITANPHVLAEAKQWIDTHNLFGKAIALLAAQPVILFLWIKMKRRQGPFAIERQKGPGHWGVIATTDSLGEAKALASEPHCRARNLHGDVIYPSL